MVNFDPLPGGGPENLRLEADILREESSHTAMSARVKAVLGQLHDHSTGLDTDNACAEEHLAPGSKAQAREQVKLSLGIRVHKAVTLRA
jgi:hypothetical protein